MHSTEPTPRKQLLAILISGRHLSDTIEICPQCQFLLCYLTAKTILNAAAQSENLAGAQQELSRHMLGTATVRALLQKEVFLLCYHTAFATSA